MISVILAAGQGTRLRPLSSYVPKILLPVRGKPVLEYILNNLKRLDIDTHYIVVSEHKETVEKYLREIKVDNVVTVRGLEWESGGDLAIALEQIKPTGDVAVMNGDIVSDIDMSRVYEDHLKGEENAYATLTALKSGRDETRFGRVTLDGDGRVTRFREKSRAGGPFISAGFYIFDRKLMKDRKSYLPFTRFKYEPVLFPRLADEGRLRASWQKPTYFWDVGTMESYLQAEDSLRI